MQLRPGLQLSQRINGPCRAVPLPDISDLSRQRWAIQPGRPFAGFFGYRFQLGPNGNTLVRPLLRLWPGRFQQPQLMLGERNQYFAEFVEPLRKKRLRSDAKLS